MLAQRTTYNYKGNFTCVLVGMVIGMLLLPNISVGVAVLSGDSTDTIVQPSTPITGLASQNPLIHNHRYLLMSHSELLSTNPPTPAAHDPIWNYTFGGTGDDFGQSVVECSGGGFAFIGDTSSFGAGSDDLWLVRTDANGQHMWNWTYGGTGMEFSGTGIEVSGGGFALCGITTSFGAGWMDMWLVRTDASGNHLWNCTYGGSNEEIGSDVVECSGGGFVLVGSTDGDGAGGSDVWLVRTDASGNHLWNQTYGGINNDYGYALVECSGGDFVLVGRTYSFGAGNGDMWLLRTDASGNHLWNYTFGGPNWDGGKSLVECSGGGFAVGGYTYNGFGAGEYDFWLVRTDANGQHLWNQTYGTSDWDKGTAVVEVNGGGFALVGETSSFGEGGTDMWLIRTNETGHPLWNQTYGGTNTDRAAGLVECSSGGFVLVGDTMSYGAGGKGDFWVVRVPLPCWVEVPTNQVADFGVPFQYDLNASSDAGLDQWWLNDTTHFAIDDQGVVTNATLLPLSATYGVQVWVNDTLGNQLSANFTVTVLDTSPPSWIEQPTDQILEPGEYLVYDLNATDPSGLDTWWLNYTIIFIIDSQGIITSTVPLPLGAYGVQVWVNDTLGHTLTATFTITVQVSDTTPPTWLVVPTDQTVEYGTVLEYQLAASDQAGLDQWWLNDTTHFIIDGTGRIISIGSLSPGRYGVQVWVNDTYGNTLTDTFMATIQDTTPPIWIVAPTDQTLVTGQSLDYHVAAWDLSGIAQWNLNDTDHFTISSSGRITNATILVIGIYGVNITATDPYGNLISAAFALIIQDATVLPPAIPPVISMSPEMILGLVGGTALGVVLGGGLTYIFSRRRRKP